METPQIRIWKEPGSTRITLSFEITAEIKELTEVISAKYQSPDLVERLVTLLDWITVQGDPYSYVDKALIAVNSAIETEFGWGYPVKESC